MAFPRCTQCLDLKLRVASTLVTGWWAQRGTMHVCMRMALTPACVPAWLCACVCAPQCSLMTFMKERVRSCGGLDALNGRRVWVYWYEQEQTVREWGRSAMFCSAMFFRPHVFERPSPSP